MAECHLNIKNRQNYHAIYKTTAVAQNNKQKNLPNDKNNQRYEGQIYERQYDNRCGGYKG